MALIPAERLASHDTSVKPRCDNRAPDPEAGVNAILIRTKPQRPRVDNEKLMVDDTHYVNFLKQHPTKIVTRNPSSIPFQPTHATDMPAAFYFYLRENQDAPEFARCFRKTN